MTTLTFQASLKTPLHLPHAGSSWYEVSNENIVLRCKNVQLLQGDVEFELPVLNEMAVIDLTNKGQTPLQRWQASFNASDQQALGFTLNQAQITVRLSDGTLLILSDPAPGTWRFLLTQWDGVSDVFYQAQKNNPAAAKIKSRFDAEPGKLELLSPWLQIGEFPGLSIPDGPTLSEDQVGSTQLSRIWA